MLAEYLGKYKSIIVSIAFFILLDASVLLLNFYISFEIADDAEGVNLAGRQRMLSQRMVKSLFDMEYSAENASERQAAQEELKLTVNLFDQTLSAFDRGGDVRAADGSGTHLQAVESAASRSAISDAKQLWEPYKALLEATWIADSADREAALLSAILYAKSNNLNMLRLMNDLTVDLENVAKSKALRLRTIQTIGILLAIINFIVILVHFVGQLRRGDQALDLAREETREILETVNEGLFLVDRNFQIASQHSKKVRDIFGNRTISGMSLEALLSDLVSDKHLETAKRFIALLFRDDIKSNLIGDLNPLREIEVNFSDEHGGYITKYLHFEFSRAYEGNKVKNVLVTVNDVTQKVKLEKELAQVRAQTEQQLEVLTGILHANPSVLKRFVTECFKGFQGINLLLREPAKSETALRKKLQEIFIEVHSFKGEAAALGLQSFESLAHEFEQQIIAVRDRKSIAGDDFLPLVVQLDKLIRHAELVQSLSKKLAAFSRVGASPVPQAPKDQWRHLHELTATVAERCGKKVELVTSGLTEVAMDEALYALVNDVAVQCIRNAVVHGIELPEERIELNKPEVGRVEVSLVQTYSGHVELSVKDDGRGLDCEAIRHKAIASGQWSAETLDHWDSKRLMSLIFEAGFSTSDVAELDAGRGVGMNIVKDRVQSQRGKIRIASRRGASTQFVIFLPPPLGQEEAA